MAHLLAVTAALLVAAAAGARAQPPTPRPIAIQNVRILTVAGAPIERGTIVIDGETIAAVGADLAVPSGAEVIDGAGLTAAPGFFDSYSHLGLLEVAQVPATVDLDEPSDPIAPHLRVTDGYYLESQLLPLVRAAGTLVILSAPGTQNPVAGQSALMRTAGRSVEDAAVKPIAALHVNLGDPPRRAHTRDGQPDADVVAMVRKAFADAREYAATSRAGANVGPDLRMQPLAAALSGELPVVVRAYRREDILSALGLADEFGFRLILLGGSEAPEVADTLAARMVPVIYGPIDLQPGPGDAKGARYDNPARLHRAGVTVAFTSNETTLARQMTANLGLAVAYGLPYDELLKGLTLYPARIFGVADRLGTLEAGKEATFFLSRGDPLQVTSPVVDVFVRGRRYPPASYQTELCTKYIAPYARSVPCLPK